MSDILLYALNLLITGILIFILIYFLITLSDLECDYLNAHECTGKLNFWNIPKLWLQVTIAFMFLITGHWYMLIINLPICIFLARRFFFVPKYCQGEYDPCEIHNTGRLKFHLFGVLLHFAWQMFAFFIFLYCLLDAVMSEPVEIETDDVEVLNRPASKHIYEPKHDDMSSDL